MKTARILRLIAAVSILGGSVACGQGRAKTARDDLLAILRRTEPLARQVDYTDVTSDRTAEVKAQVEDGFRYSAQTSVDGALAYEQVVSDDALAFRAANATLVPRALPAAAAMVGTPAASGAWVVDKAGAPSVTGSATERRIVGENPVTDALTVLAYVDQAAGQALKIKKFNPDDIEYRPQEDPFPKPDLNAREDRYDFYRPDLPRVSDLGGANQATPGIEHFRKMVVYVNNGRITRIGEHIDVPSRLKDLQRIYNVKFPDNVPTSELVSVAVDSINALRRGQGNDPIRVRTMTAKFSNFGTVSPIAVPPGSDGTLPFLRPAAATATTTVPGAPAGVPAIPNLSQGATGQPDANGGATLAGLASGGAPSAASPAPAGFNLGALGTGGRTAQTATRNVPSPSSGSVVLWLVALPLVVVVGGGIALRFRGSAGL